MIPFFNSWLSVRNNFLMHPILRVVYDPIFPLLNFYKSIPYVGFVTFVALIVGVVRDRRFSRYVRFNSLQVLLLDFVLVIPPYLITNAMNWFQTDEGLGLKVAEICGNGIFFLIGVLLLYNLGCCLLGKSPRFPVVSDTVDMQLTAFDRQF
ncbi:hypothetical protein GIB67_006033 [Kingdonia uniflora]|uniref:Protein TIC 20 n=1 Tax=Kingdonia uniflora TaxID=39325 RepID=A0A7J7P0D7_9MAGN|nr:hypothetical protein GIB67_041118 [Kingdonia uniflora]KAF6172790.1 hypothetical protein GIB67_006033 [Kingdonia uniflora]